MIWEYSTDLFEEATIARMIEHYQTLARHTIANPGRQIVDLPLLSQAEQTLLLDTWNPPPEPFPAPLGVHHHFTIQAQRTPDAIALCWGEQQLTYQQLEQRSSQLAGQLRTLGVGPDCIVALWLERSPLLLIGLLAVLKAGGAYLPLSPTLPPARLHALLLQAQAHALLSQHSLLLALSAPPSLPCLTLDTLPLDTALPPQHAPAPQPPFHPEHLAYVIFTSGSTGTPKGVMISHRNLLHLIDWHRQACALSAADRVSQLADLSFDAMGWEIWPALLSGACLCLPAEQTHILPPHLQRWLQQAALTVSFLPTPLAEQVLRQPHDWPCPMALRLLLTGGDRLHAVELPPFACTLVNNYGPTETTVVATCAPVRAQPPTAPPPGIGAPISRMQAYLLDARLQPVPLGVPGELYLGGTGLGRGYLQRPDLTAERFLPHPFSPQPGERLYRTGDFARWRPDGTLEFVGRRDEQVKVRGFRVELGEIEAVLRAHPAVHEAVVLLREQREGEAGLVAYVVPVDPQAGLGRELRSWLGQRLPTYMLPGAFVCLERLPVTAQGKLDRRALPAAATPAGGEVEPGEPGTALEQVLAGIWGEVLDLEQVGIHDNFFALGGHSLLFTQVAARVYDAFQVELPLRSLFEKPTVSEQATLLFHNPEERARIEKTAQLLVMLAQLSDNEVDAMSDSIMLSSQEG